jgi:hypothetical protein
MINSDHTNSHHRGMVEATILMSTDITAWDKVFLFTTLNLFLDFIKNVLKNSHIEFAKKDGETHIHGFSRVIIEDEEV